METVALSTRVALIGATGRTGGWVLESAIERGYEIRALTRKKEKLSNYADKITLVEGDATDEATLQELVYNSNGELLVDVIISTIGSPSKNTLVVEATAKALVNVLTNHDNIPRVVWMTSTGINEATDQAKSYPCCGSPNRYCCGYGCFGWLLFKCLIPFIIGQDLWNDMALSEDVIRNESSVKDKTVFVRPTNMYPVSESTVFTEKWRKEGGDDLKYELIGADDPPPSKWICRKAIAECLLDLAVDASKDGTAVSLFRRED